MTDTTSGTSVVLVHGAFVDGSGWRPVHDILAARGHEVLVVQTPNLSLSGDVAATARVIAAARHPVVLVGHSYGGAVITGAGDDPKVRALVCIAAFAPDAGESVAEAPGPSSRNPKRSTMAASPSAPSSVLPTGGGAALPDPSDTAVLLLDHQSGPVQTGPDRSRPSRTSRSPTCAAMSR